MPYDLRRSNESVNLEKADDHNKLLKFSLLKKQTERVKHQQSSFELSRSCNESLKKYTDMPTTVFHNLIYR